MISYPVNVAKDRFTFKLGETVKRRQVWPRDDGQKLVGADAALVILQEFSTTPTTKANLEKLDNWRWIDDPQNQTATYTADVVALSEAELAAIAANAALDAKRAALAEAIPSLRQWAQDVSKVTVSSANAVATLDTTLKKLAVFFDEFADLLEVMSINK